MSQRKRLTSNHKEVPESIHALARAVALQQIDADELFAHIEQTDQTKSNPCSLIQSSLANFDI